MLRLLLLLLLTGGLLFLAPRLVRRFAHQPGQPLEIRRGGTYTGAFRSTSSEVPCVRILTTEPVVLDSCVLEGSGHLIDCPTPGANLVVRRCVGRGLLPTEHRVARGRFFNANEPRSVRIEHCRLEQTTGIYIDKWQGNGSAGQTLKVLGNQVRNIDGRYRDGGGSAAAFVGLNTVRGVAGIEIAWNEVINIPNQSLVEDNINLYNSSGTPASPIRVHDNYVQGAYPYPADAPVYTGTGLNTDGDGRSALTTTAYVEAYNNQFVSTCNAAMNIAAGHHVYYHHNRMVTSALLPDGQPLRATYAATSVFNGYQQPATVFFAHRIEQNVIGYVKPGYQIPYPNRHDLSHESCAPCRQNTHLPNPITLSTEQQEWYLWQQKQRVYTAETARRIYGK